MTEARQKIIGIGHNKAESNNESLDMYCKVSINYVLSTITAVNIIIRICEYYKELNM